MVYNPIITDDQYVIYDMYTYLYIYIYMYDDDLAGGIPTPLKNMTMDFHVAKLNVIKKKKLPQVIIMFYGWDSNHLQGKVTCSNKKSGWWYTYPPLKHISQLG